MEVSTESLKNLNDQQRKTLIDSINDGSCILVLGPYANLTSDDRPQRVVLANYLADKMPTNVPADDGERDSFGSIVGRILLDSKYLKTDVLDTIKDFYREFDKPPKNKIAPNSPYDLIVKLGFKTIFTTDPDSRLMNLFSDRNKQPLGLYFKINPQPEIATFLESNSSLDDDIPLIVNLFGIRDNPYSLAIGPKDELQQLNMLTSQEVIDMITIKIGSRLSGCRWHLFVGFNFNSWALATIIYFFNKLTLNTNRNELINLTELTQSSRVIGLHSKPNDALKESTIVYFKNLFPKDTNKNDILINNQDAQTFFTELDALVEQASVPDTPSPTDKQAFIVYHPKDEDRIASFRTSLESKLSQLYYLTVQYNIPSSFEPLLNDEEIQQHVKTDDIVVFLISTNWDDPRYDKFLALAIDRDCSPTQVMGILLDGYILVDGQRKQKPAFDMGAVKLLNNPKTQNVLTDPESVTKELDRFLTKVLN